MRALYMQPYIWMYKTFTRWIMTNVLYEILECIIATEDNQLPSERRNCPKLLSIFANKHFVKSCLGSIHISCRDEAESLTGGDVFAVFFSKFR